MPEYTGPHDYFDPAYVNEWAGAANSRRPYRAEFFNAFVAELAVISRPKILEIGSGPGFLAEQVLARCDVAAYHLFDFSPHMLGLSRARLAHYGQRATFHEGSFLNEGWWHHLPTPFDAALSLQAVHEVRDAARIPRLYGELKMLLKEGGVLLIADQVNDEDREEEHFLRVSEHEAALRRAGFEEFRRVHAAGDLVLFSAKRY
ncbi:MAG TPA: class I SAM-dependent methyltransferase [Blastocatellia bacterium]|nr:class I SAM-dependent methyltransferase [Blastocatellia bacterium]